MNRIANWIGCAAAALLATGCGEGAGGIVPTGPLFVGQTVTVTVSCPSQMEVSQWAQCSAYGYDSNGTFTSGAVSSWSSSNTSRATVSSSGWVNAVGTGSVTISATIDGVTGSTSINVVPQALNVWITGPDEVLPNAQCSWLAYASGGTGSYSYSWYGPGGTGSSQDYFITSPSSGSFYVEVTVNDGNTSKFAYKLVTVSQFAGMCPL